MGWIKMIKIIKPGTKKEVESTKCGALLVPKDILKEIEPFIH